nr:immunoglobulin heavy chain junction region [Mus musculus]
CARVPGTDYAMDYW